MLLAASQARGARAQALPEAIALSWSAPPDCPGEAEARRALAELLGPAPADGWPGLEVEARVVPEPPAGFRLTLRFDGDREGSRSLTAASCADLTRAAAVLIHLTIEEAPPSTAAAPPVAATGEATNVDADADADVEGGATPSGTTDDARASPALGLAVSAGLALDLGTLPTLVAGVGGSARLSVGALDVGIEGALMPGMDEALEPGSEARASFALWQLGVVACLPFAEAAWRLGPCAGVMVMALSGESTGVLDPEREDAVVLGARLGGTLRWRMTTELALQLDLSAAIPFQRSAWRVRDYAYVHRPAAIAGQLGLGLVVLL